MIPIYLCDDQESILSELKELIDRIIMIHDLPFRIELATTDPDELLRHLQQAPAQGIYFLDVDLGLNKMNGFELGQKIREVDSRGFLIYVTTHEELLSETFKHRLEALDYIIKNQVDILNASIFACLSAISQRLANDKRETRQYFRVEKGARTDYVPMEEIIYFETSHKKHVVTLHTKDSTIEFYGSLNEVEEKINQDFFRVHRAFLVNSQHIRSCDYKEKRVYLSAGKNCDIARSKIKQMRQLLEERK